MGKHPGPQKKNKKKKTTSVWLDQKEKPKMCNNSHGRYNNDF